MGENNGVEDDHLAGYHHVASEDGDGGVELAAAIEQCIVLHLSKWFVGVRILWRTLDPGPITHSGVPADDGVDDQGVLPHRGVAEHDALPDSGPSPHSHVLADTHVGAKDSAGVHHCCLVDEDITDNLRSFLAFLGQSFRIGFVVERKCVSVGVDGAARCLDLTPPVVGQVKEGFVGASDGNKDVSFNPNCFVFVTITDWLRTCQVFTFLRIENTLK